MSVMTMGEYIATLPFCISRHGKAMEDIIGQRCTSVTQADCHTRHRRPST